MKKKLAIVPFVFLLTVLLSVAKAQSNKSYFKEETVNNATDKDYGSITITTYKGETKVIEYIMAYGENVKALDVQVNDGFTFKLAPAPAGMNLNYIGSSLNIVIKDGDKLKIDFANGNANIKREAEKHIYVSGSLIK